MPEFGVDVAQNEIEGAILGGTYAFADYAVCFWVLHVESALSTFNEQVSDRREEIIECLEVFLSSYWQHSEKVHVVSKSLKEHLITLRHHPLHNNACQAMAAAKSWLRPTAKAPTTDEVIRLPCVVAQTRAGLEHIMSSSTITRESRAILTQNNGANCYKCDRMNCQFFHQGFSDVTQRNQHLNKHERSYTCIEDGCPYLIIGFTTAKELENHAHESHGMEVENVGLEFPEDVKLKPLKDVEFQPHNDVESAPPDTLIPKGIRNFRNQLQPRKPPNNVTCRLCGNTYTRAYNLKSHMRTHTNDRPFSCTVCGKKFARQHDRNRHEISHSDEKQFFCRVEDQSPSGISEGCGKQFGRADALSVHLRSEAGSACLKPLGDQEASKRRNIQEID